MTGQGLENDKSHYSSRSSVHGQREPTACWMGAERERCPRYHMHQIPEEVRLTNAFAFVYGKALSKVPEGATEVGGEDRAVVVERNMAYGRSKDDRQRKRA